MTLVMQFSTFDPCSDVSISDNNYLINDFFASAMCSRQTSFLRPIWQCSSSSSSNEMQQQCLQSVKEDKPVSEIESRQEERHLSIVSPILLTYCYILTYINYNAYVCSVNAHSHCGDWGQERPTLIPLTTENAKRS